MCDPVGLVPEYLHVRHVLVDVPFGHHPLRLQTHKQHVAQFGAHHGHVLPAERLPPRQARRLACRGGEAD